MTNRTYLVAQRIPPGQELGVVVCDTCDGFVTFLLPARNATEARDDATLYAVKGQAHAGHTLRTIPTNGLRLRQATKHLRQGIDLSKL